MRVLVYPHDMELGGSSINAVDLAAAVRELGHDPVVIARPGPLADLVREKDLPLVTVHVPARPRPWPGVIADIRTVVRRHRIELVHTYEFWPCLEAYFAVGATGRAPVVGTIMSMGLMPFLPRSVPLTLGYRDLLDQARARQRAAVHLLEPPIDTSSDRPGVDTSSFRERFGLDEGHLDVVIVSRTAVVMKQEGIERTIDAVGRLAPEHPVRLIIVGGGSAFDALLARADGVNRAVGRRVVVMTGPIPDPRPAYELADVVVGMGSSALRAMAFHKPVLVVGENGFSAVVGPGTAALFDRTGFYGVGHGRPGPEDDPLTGQLRALLDDRAARERLGAFGARLVDEQLALPVAARKLDRVYRLAAESASSGWRRLPDTAMTAGRVVVHKARDGGVLGRLRPLTAGQR